jgi:hypothetical protein
MSEKEFEQTEFSRGEGQLFVPQGEPVRGAIQGEWAEPQESGIRGLRRRPARRA